MFIRHDFDKIVEYNKLVLSPKKKH